MLRSEGFFRKRRILAQVLSGAILLSWIAGAAAAREVFLRPVHEDEAFEFSTGLFGSERYISAARADVTLSTSSEDFAPDVNTLPLDYEFPVMLDADRADAGATGIATLSADAVLAGDLLFSLDLQTTAMGDFPDEGDAVYANAWSGLIVAFEVVDSPVSTTFTGQLNATGRRTGSAIDLWRDEDGVPGGSSFQSELSESARSDSRPAYTLNTVLTLDPGLYYLNHLTYAGPSVAFGSGAADGTVSVEFDVLPPPPMEFHWDNPAGGGFGDSDNWQENDVPRETTHTAIFGLDGAYTVDFAENVVNGKARIEAGQVTFDLNGNTYEVSNSDSVDTSLEGGRLTVTDGTLSTDVATIVDSARLRVGANGLFHANSLLVPTVDVGPGETVEVDGGHLNAASQFELNDADASVLVHNGGQLSVGDLDNSISGGRLTLQQATSFVVTGENSQLTTDEVEITGPVILAKVEDSATAVVKNRTFIDVEVALGAEGLSVADAFYNSPDGALEMPRGVFDVSQGGRAFFDSAEAGPESANGPAPAAFLRVDGADSLFDVTQDLLLRNQVDFKVTGGATLEAGALTLQDVVFSGANEDAAPTVEAAAMNLEALSVMYSTLDVSNSDVTLTGAAEVVGEENRTSTLGVFESTYMEGTSLEVRGAGPPAEGDPPHAGVFVETGTLSFPQGITVRDGRVVVLGGQLNAVGGPLSVEGGRVDVSGQSTTAHAGTLTMGAEAGSSPGAFSLREATLTVDSSMVLGEAAEALLEIDDEAEIEAGGAVIVYQHGQMALRNGGDLRSESGVVDGGTVFIEHGGSTWFATNNIQIGNEALGTFTRLRNNGSMGFDTLFVYDGSEVDGTGIYQGSIVDYSGSFSGGLSAGTATFDVDLFRLNDGGELILEIGGTTAGVEHDQIIFTGDVVLDGRIVFRFIDGFGPTLGDTFDLLMTGGAADLSKASFEVQNLLPGYEYEFTPAAGGMRMVAMTDGTYVPEPASVLLLGPTACGLLRRRRRCVASPGGHLLSPAAVRDLRGTGRGGGRCRR